MTFPLRYFLTADKLAPDSHNTAPSAINIINEPCFAIHFQSLFLCVYSFLLSYITWKIPNHPTKVCFLK